jgi:hypothetical protein
LANADGEVGVDAHHLAGAERISGPRITSTPGNLLNGKTDSLTDVWAGR